MARDAGGKGPRAEAVEQRYRNLPGPAHTAERLALATEAIRLAERGGDHEAALRARVWRITDLVELGQFAEAEADIELHARLAERHRHPPALWRAAVFRAMRATLRGRFEEAERLATRALEMGQRIKEPNAINVFGAQMLALRREQGRIAELEAVHRNFLEQHPDHPGWRCALALIYAESGREENARAELERVFTRVAESQPDPFWLLAVATLSDVCAFAGDATRAPRLYELLSPYRERCVIVGHAAGCLGSVSYYLARLARTCGSWGAAEGHFEEALRVNTALGGPAILARTRHAHADCILARLDAEPWRDRQVEHRRALALIDSALATYLQLGMTSYRERAVAAKLRALGGSATEPGSTAGSAPPASPSAVPRGVPEPVAGDGRESEARLGAEISTSPVQRWETYSTLLKIRLGVCFVLAAVVPAGLFLAQRGDERWAPNTWPLLAIVAIATVLGLSYYAAARRPQPTIGPPAGFVYLVHWIDALLATTAMAFLGGVDVFVGLPIYALIIVHTAIEVSPGRVFVLAAAASAGYAVAVLGLPVESDFRRPILVDVGRLGQNDFAAQARLVLSVVNALFLGVLSFLTTTLTGVTLRQTARAQSAEARLRNLNLELEKKVAARTRALNAANATLISSNLALEALNREVELYAKAVSHDIRSPIAAASEALRLLDGHAGGDAAPRLQLMTKSLRLAEGMLSGLVELMRSRAVEPAAPVATRELLSEVIEEVRTVRNAGELRIDLVGSFFDVVAQPKKLGHVFRNLIDNAVQHTRGRPDGRVEIGQRADGDAAVFWVRDNGEGIPYAEQEAVFEPFYRGTNSNGGGIGIGLALVRQIVEQHGGRVWVDSVPGNGATFWVKIPTRPPLRAEERNGNR
jgi:signal transduction histidine kinase/tetratricopeptide (TPR) repeat protein